MGRLLRAGDAEPERAACLKLHSKCQERNGPWLPMAELARLKQRR